MIVVVQILGWWTLGALVLGLVWIAFHINYKWRTRRQQRFTWTMYYHVDSTPNRDWTTDAVMMVPGQHHSVPIPKECFPEADRKVLEDLEAP